MYSMTLLFETSFRLLDGLLSRSPVLCLFLLSGGLILGSMILDRKNRVGVSTPKTPISNHSVGDGRA
ncbi:hypothetical protein SAMN05444167_1994 [Terriglobus roseus]|uniref:Uncharacterized protein n=1 Tax=Terriglobus roseus TaxID=392734 RepID=A0A1G7JYM6_9BACT|nr:hypothetical protein SAMN05444167_1994 [Terriglobus roseus]